MIKLEMCRTGCYCIILFVVTCYVWLLWDPTTGFKRKVNLTELKIKPQQLIVYQKGSFRPSTKTTKCGTIDIVNQEGYMPSICLRANKANIVCIPMVSLKSGWSKASDYASYP